MDVAAAIRAGELVVLPTDTVYGLVTTPQTEEATRRLYEVKRRPAGMPSALLAADLDALLEAVPELRGDPETVARALLPGPYTLIFANPARRFPWFAGDTIGIRVVDLPPPADEIVRRSGPVVSTSANLHGAGETRRVEDLPEELREACAAVVDAGELPGVPSTVLDFSGEEPRVLREGAASGAQAIALVRGRRPPPPSLR